MSASTVGGAASLAGAASYLAQINAPPQSTTHSIAGYSGPTIPELRRNPGVSAAAQEALDYLFQQIPALASYPSQQAPVMTSHPRVSVQQPLAASVAPLLPSFPLQQQPQLPVAAPYPPLQPAPVYHQHVMQSAGHVPALQQPQLVPGVGGPLQPLLGAPLPLQPDYSNLDQDTSQRSLQSQDGSNSKPVNLDDLLSATIKHKEFSAIDFAKLSKFSYISNLNHTNLNLSLFAYGSIRHLLLLSNGTLPAVSKAEFNARLQHLLHVLEITCLESNLLEFNSNSFKVAKEYDKVILSDIQEGYKTWESLDRCIDSTAWNVAIRMVPAVTKSQPQSKSQNNSNSSQKICTTWNTFRSGEGCHFEFTNPGQKCVYLHHCSTCRQKGFPNRHHKAIHCNQGNSQSASTVTPPVAALSAPVAVTTSV